MGNCMEPNDNQTNKKPTPINNVNTYPSIEDVLQKRKFNSSNVRKKNSK